MTQSQNKLITRCPICNYNQSEEIVRSNMYDTSFVVLQCKVCDHGYLNPIPSFEMLSMIAKVDYGLNSLTPKSNDKLIEKYTRIFFRRVNQNFPDNERKLLVISNSQEIFESVAQKAGWNTNAISFNDFMKHANDNQYSGLSISEKYRNYNLIALDNVFEHFLDPIRDLCTISNCLEKDGRILLIVPNIESKSFKLQGKNWKYISIPFHINYFNRFGIDSIFLKKLAKLKVNFKKIFQTTLTWDEGAGEEIVALYKKT